MSPVVFLWHDDWSVFLPGVFFTRWGRHWFHGVVWIQIAATGNCRLHMQTICEFQHTQWLVLMNLFIFGVSAIVVALHSFVMCFCYFLFSFFFLIAMNFLWKWDFSFQYQLQFWSIYILILGTGSAEQQWTGITPSPPTEVHSDLSRSPKCPLIFSMCLYENTSWWH